MPDSKTSERQSGAYVDRIPRDYGSLARILRKPIFGLGKYRRGTDEDGWYTGTLPVKEVEKAIKSMKRGKAAGPDEISNELLKLGEYTMSVVSKCRRGYRPRDGETEVPAEAEVTQETQESYTIRLQAN